LALARYKQLIPKPIIPVVRAVAYFAYRVYVRLWIAHLDFWEKRDPDIPSAWLRYRVGESPDLPLFLDVGKRSAANIEAALQRAGRPLETMGAVLDFGCGCGRTLRWLAPRLQNARISGTDTDAEAIEWCCTHLRGEFGVNGPLPPLDYPDESFDLIYAISVFTHLDEEFQLRWLRELRRVLKPDGLLLFSVHGPAAWGELEQADLRGLERRGFLFKSSSKLKGIFPEWYHTAYHSEPYVRDEIGKLFAGIDYIPEGMGYQDLVIARKTGE
jgi:SAM-dependent methyltransferase